MASKVVPLPLHHVNFMLEPACGFRMKWVAHGCGRLCDVAGGTPMASKAVPLPLHHGSFTLEANV